MVILSTQKMQRLADRLQQLERGVERAGGEVEDEKEEMTEEDTDHSEVAVEEDLSDVAARAGVELSTVRRMDAATLSRALSRGPGAGGGRVWAAAEVLYMDGLAARARREESVARSRWEKAAHLYRQLDEGMELPEDATPPARRIERIEAWTGR